MGNWRPKEKGLKTSPPHQFNKRELRTKKKQKRTKEAKCSLLHPKLCRKNLKKPTNPGNATQTINRPIGFHPLHGQPQQRISALDLLTRGDEGVGPAVSVLYRCVISTNLHMITRRLRNCHSKPASMAPGSFKGATGAIGEAAAGAIGGGAELVGMSTSCSLMYSFNSNAKAGSPEATVIRN